MMDIVTSIERWPLKEPFRISRYTFTESLVVTATITDDAGNVGVGECEPHGWEETVAHQQLSRAMALPGAKRQPAWLPGLARANVLERLERNPFRNGVDCALWDLEAKRAGVRAHVLAETTVNPVRVMPTIGIDTPAEMARRAGACLGASWIKVKLGGKDGLDPERLEAVASALPGVPILVDPNCGWDLPELKSMLPLAQSLGIRIVEQPLLPEFNDVMPPAFGDIRFCADESCLDRGSLPAVHGRFQMVNVKLDKTGGLSEALALRKAAEGLGMGVMVGMMSGTSLAVAPAFVLSQGLDVVDLEIGYMTDDRVPAMTLDNFVLQPPAAALWG
jgi:L-alanine-DL-glutamate epimerase-like enolase superfamily enzyme